MKLPHIFILIAVLLLAAGVSACAGRPTEMIQQTEQVRNEAASEHADQFAAEQWGQAEKAWQEASGKLDAKSYGDAQTLLLKAKTYYVRARDTAKSRRADAINRITKAQETANIRCKTDLKDAPAAKKLTGTRKKEFDDEVKQIDDSIAKVTTMLQNAQYSEAQNLIDRTLRRIWEVQQEYFKK